MLNDRKSQVALSVVGRKSSVGSNSYNILKTRKWKKLVLSGLKPHGIL